MFQIVLYFFLHSTLVLSVYIDVVTFYSYNVILFHCCLVTTYDHHWFRQLPVAKHLYLWRIEPMRTHFSDNRVKIQIRKSRVYGI